MSDLGSFLPSLLLPPAAIVLAGFIFFLMRGGRLSSFDLEMLKGPFRFRGTADTSTARQTERQLRDQAYDVLRWLQQKLARVDGNFVINDSRNENAKTAAQLYSKLEGEVIATSFFESPDYGMGDPANALSPGVRFTRLTVRKLCDAETERIVQDRLSSFDCHGRLVVLESSTEISLIDGVFSRLPDKSYVVFVVMNNAENRGINKGLVFSGKIAEQLFQYYRGFLT